MMVKIRLARHGAKKRPYYHIVVADSESPRDGRFLEQVGTYDPSRPDDEIRLELDRVDHWLSVGAKPSDRVRKVINLMRRRALEVPAVEAAPAEAAPAEAAPAEAAPAEAPAAEAAAEAA
ncbi:MAG: 30S ribosomal protein S16, partial [Sandaracinaceae bacterium]